MIRLPLKYLLIREETEYGGTRIILLARLGRARVTLQFDIGVGDAITPPPKLTDFPVLLNGPIPRMNYLGAEPARYLVCAKLYFKIKL